MLQPFRPRFWFTFHALIIFIYIFMATSVTDPFNCVQDAYGNYFMRRAVDTPCFDSAWNTNIVFAVLFVIIYVIGIPVYFFYIILRAFRSLSLEKDAFLSHYAFLVQHYKPSKYYWYFLIFDEETREGPRQSKRESYCPGTNQCVMVWCV